MPRKARIDAPSAIHHVIGRGINRQEIFSDRKDYNNFLERLGDLLTESKTSCYAWALIPNHFHLLGDERILGGGEFVKDVLARAEEEMENKYRMKIKGFDLESLIRRVTELTELTEDEILDGVRDKKRTDARSILVHWATDQLGITQVKLAEKLNLTQSAISHAARRGRILVKSNQYSVS